MKKLLIWGAGDQGLVTLDCALATRKYTQIDFLNIKEKGHRNIENYKIYEESNENLLEFINSYNEVIVATGDNYLRELKIKQLLAMNAPLTTIIHPTASISPFATISKGNTILANAIININASIAMGCIINNGVIVEHDCIIEDFVNISPNTAMAGHTTIGRKTFIGIGSTIINNIRVGEGVIVGAGAVVVSDIDDNMTVVGVPAKEIKKNRY